MEYKPDNLNFVIAKETLIDAGRMKNLGQKLYETSYDSVEEFA